MQVVEEICVQGGKMLLTQERGVNEKQIES